MASFISIKGRAAMSLWPLAICSALALVRIIVANPKSAVEEVENIIASLSLIAWFRETAWVAA